MYLFAYFNARKFVSLERGAPERLRREKDGTRKKQKKKRERTNLNTKGRAPDLWVGRKEVRIVKSNTQRRECKVQLMSLNEKRDALRHSGIGEIWWKSRSGGFDTSGSGMIGIYCTPWGKCEIMQSSVNVQRPRIFDKHSQWASNKQPKSITNFAFNIIRPADNWPKRCGIVEKPRKRRKNVSMFGSNEIIKI